MINKNTKFIIATNAHEENYSTDFLENNILQPIKQLHESEPELLFKPTEALMVYATYKSAADGKIPIVVPVGGDGTINWHINNSDIYAPSTIYLPFADGTANDIASTIYQEPSDFNKILTKGKLKQPKPLLIQNGNIQKKALGYIGLGITGQCAKEINSRKDQQPSIIRDSIVSMKGIIKSRKLKVKNIDSGLSNKHMEIAAVNSRMASFLWPKDPAVFEDHFYLVSPEGYFKTANVALRGLKKHLGGRKVQLGQNIEFTIENIKDKKRPIYGQCDGEEFILEDKHIIISKTNRPINLITL
jgi:diacylglycerol kinase family enzyme